MTLGAGAGASAGTLPRLWVLTDERAEWERTLWAAREVASLGPRVALLYREPSATGRTQWERARALNPRAPELAVPRSGGTPQDRS